MAQEDAPVAPQGKPVTELYDRHPGSDIYVVGTGPSLRVFPVGLLEDRISIGLNQAWRTVPVRYGMTIHPELSIPEFLEGSDQRPDITWVTKREKLGALPSEQREQGLDRFYFFRSDGPKQTTTHGLSDAGREPEWARRPTSDFLYLWGSIATSAVNLAANMGARNVVLVGCDNSALFGNHHANAQHTRWLGSKPDDRYADYYEGLAEVRTAVRERGVTVVSLHPFLTLGPHEDDFLRLCDELDLPRHVPTLGDISPDRRTLWSRARARAGALERAARRRLQPHGSSH